MKQLYIYIYILIQTLEREREYKHVWWAEITGGMQFGGYGQTSVTVLTFTYICIQHLLDLNIKCNILHQSWSYFKHPLPIFTGLYSLVLCGQHAPLFWSICTEFDSGILKHIQKRLSSIPKNVRWQNAVHPYPHLPTARFLPCMFLSRRIFWGQVVVGPGFWCSINIR